MRLIRAFITQVVQGCRKVLWLLLLAGLILHFTVRDRVDEIAFLFYVLSMPVLLGISLLLGWGSRPETRCRKTAMFLSLVIVVTWCTRSWRWHAAPASAERQPGEVRVMFWNLSRPPGGAPFADFVKLVGEFEPDLIGCTEPAFKGQKIDAEVWQRALPGYRLGQPFQELLYYTRETPRNESSGMLNGIGSYVRAEMDLADRVAPLVVTDIWASPWIPRTQQLKEALALVADRPNALLIGDFNTPAESAHFDAFRKDLSDAFEMGGRGLRETWFYGLPMLSIDHVWVGRDWQVLDTRKVWSLDSDHAALLVRLLPRPLSAAATKDQSIGQGTGE